MMWSLFLLAGILPAFALAFSFQLFFFFRGEESWVVEVASGIKLVALVSRLDPPSGVVDILL